MTEITHSTTAILFVDDEKNILRSLKRLTVDEPYTVFVAESGREGLEIFAEHGEIGIIVSDQRMPQMTGAEFLEKSREIRSDVTRMILTGYADLETAMSAINQGGASRYISKPWDDEELLHILRSAVQQYELIRENKRLQAVIRQKNQELETWNSRLKSKVLQQTSEIRKRNVALRATNLQLERNNATAISAFSELIGMRNEKMRNHARKVADLSIALARSAGVDEADCNTIRVAALLHDIGKVALPDIFLSQSVEELSSEGLKQYQLHPVRGASVVETIEGLQQAGSLIRHHHEHWDGSGFPDSLCGEDIPLGSRIIALADYCDHCIKTYEILDLAEIVQHVSDYCGSRFDTQFEAFLPPILKAAYQELTAEQNKTVLLSPNELCEGMRLAEDLMTGTGVLLLNAGAILTVAVLQSILRFHKIDPFPSGVLIVHEGEDSL